jgi:hypothetical protein
MRVAALLLVPGVLIRMAVIEPENVVAPTPPLNITKASRGASASVNGSRIVIVTVPPIPGIVPRIIPARMPIMRYIQLEATTLAAKLRFEYNHSK